MSQMGHGILLLIYCSYYYCYYYYYYYYHYYFMSKELGSNNSIFSLLNFWNFYTWGATMKIRLLFVLFYPCHKDSISFTVNNCYALFFLNISITSLRFLFYSFYQFWRNKTYLLSYTLYKRFLQPLF